MINGNLFCGVKIKYLFFNKRDHELIRIVNSVYDADDTLGYTRKLYYSFFHPLGIKELAESKGLRTAYSIVALLESMERGGIERRLQALRGVKDDVLSASDGPMPKNTARVLLQIMKELVRAKADYSLQLQLAHDFRVAAVGKPRVVRKLLKHYHLLEMPEDWNQLTFDDHVHDANTVGRKSPTHFIMDAWIKGIRRLRVIYYNYIEPRFAVELIEAARIMEIEIRIGIEFWVRYRSRYISLIWVARKLPDAEAFLCFLAEPHVVKFMEQGKAIVDFQKSQVLHLLDNFNEQYLNELCSNLDIEMEKLDAGGFLRFSSHGQPSVPHLGEYIHFLAVRAMKQCIDQLSQVFGRSDAKEQFRIKNLIAKMNSFTAQDVISNYLSPSQHSDILYLSADCNDHDIPDRLKLSFKELIGMVKALHSDFRITLKLSNLRPEDILEILYEGNGLITRLEIINLRDFVTGKTDHIFSANLLQNAINTGSLLKLKRLVRQIIQRVDRSEYADKSDRMEKLLNILYDIDALKNMYTIRPLKSRIGSDSSGKSYQAYGMGFAIVNTLVFGALKEVKKNIGGRLMLPVNINVSRRMTYFPVTSVKPIFKWMMNVLWWLPGCDQIMPVKKKDWVFDSFSLDMEKKGNIVTLGGIQKETSNSLGLELQAAKKSMGKNSWKNLNTTLKNCLKVFIGFIPAFTCFVLTKDWWFLAYFGAFIWFAITGFRVITQSVLGGGGINRSSLLKWNDYVSWERLTDSLLYTGFSVPFLDYVIKTLVLDRTFGINMTSSPLALYSVMALSNGVYISLHNFFRGFPKGVIAGNFFRSVFSIPVAILFNTLIGGILAFFNVPAIDVILQKWVAIISKLASEMVAGFIEGMADRIRNMRLRKRDIKKKFSALFEAYSRLELLFPETEELKILEKPEVLFQSRNSEVKDLAVMIIIDSLDMFYFWMYLPRARSKMSNMVSRLTPEEKSIFFLSQGMLKHEQYISRLFVDGILGSNFSRSLSFYLTNHKKYLSGIARMK
ncbi:MAG: hypothetical protein GY710_15875 [Desulfobacteraceae bacterium]|nr:hypothetical protein [Desulfobacteraceae bacterium]